MLSALIKGEIMLPDYIEAMRASEPENALEILDNPKYTQEYKWDGSRTFAFIDGNKLQLVGKSWIQEYSWLNRIYNELPSLKTKGLTVLDCESVWLHPDGHDEMLTVEATPEKAKSKNLEIFLKCFDIVKLNGSSDVRALQYTKRKEILRDIIPEGLKVVHYVEPMENTSANYNYIVDTWKGEGVVAKLKISPYIADKKLSERLAYWVKIKKANTADCIVLGCSYGNGARASTFGSLILGQYTEDGKLIFVGKDGHLNQNMLNALLTKMKERAVMESPVDNYPDNDVMLWCNPKLDPIVVELFYHRRTSNNVMRFPKFKQLRKDKLAEDCIQWGYKSK